MIDAIDGMCKTWGAQKLFILRTAHVEVVKPVPRDITAIAKLTDRQAAIERFKVEQAMASKAVTESHIQGWTPQSVLAKFKDMRDGAGSATQREVLQFTEEGHIGEGLMVARALSDAPEMLRAVVYAHYVIPRVRAKIKAQTIGVSVPEYWRHIDRSHYWIAARVPYELTITPAQSA